MGDLRLAVADMLQHVVGDADVKGFVGKRELGVADQLKDEPIVDPALIDDVHGMHLTMRSDVCAEVCCNEPGSSPDLEDPRPGNRCHQGEQGLDLPGLLGAGVSIEGRMWSAFRFDVHAAGASREPDNAAKSSENLAAEVPRLKFSTACE